MCSVDSDVSLLDRLDDSLLDRLEDHILIPYVSICQASLQIQLWPGLRTPSNKKRVSRFNIETLGGDCLIERVKRWLTRSWVDCESPVGKLERPNARRPRKLAR